MHRLTTVWPRAPNRAAVGEVLCTQASGRIVLYSARRSRTSRFSQRHRTPASQTAQLVPPQARRRCLSRRADVGVRLASMDFGTSQAVVCVIGTSLVRVRSPVRHSNNPPFRSNDAIAATALSGSTKYLRIKSRMVQHMTSMIWHHTHTTMNSLDHCTAHGQ